MCTVALAKLLREKNTSLSLPQKENARTSPQDRDHSLLALSCCCSTKAKSCYIRNLKVEKTEDAREGRHPPRLRAQSFSGKSRGPSVFYCECLSDFQRAPKELQSLDLHCTCSLHTPREASETGGRAPERMLLVPYFELI